MEYKDFVRYAALTAALTLNRPEFKTKVVNCPEILEVIHEIPHLLAAIEQSVKHDHYLHLHYRYYVREMRIRAYAQLLESYRSLTIEYMAKAFGVTEEWIDQYFLLM